MAKRHAGMSHFSDAIRTAKSGGMPLLVEKELDVPLTKKKPCRIGVQFMGDLFHNDVRHADLLRVFEAMSNAGQHTYLL